MPSQSGSTPAAAPAAVARIAFGAPAGLLQRHLVWVALLLLLSMPASPGPPSMPASTA